jgi:hypothetical protein
MDGGIGAGGPGGSDKKRNSKKRNSKKMKIEDLPVAPIRMLSMMVFEASPSYMWSDAVGVQRFDDYPDGLECNGAESLQHTRHCAFYLEYDGLQSAIRIRFYEHTPPPDCHGTRTILDGHQVYPEYLPDTLMKTTPTVRVHELNDFASIATQV